MKEEAGADVQKWLRAVAAYEAEFKKWQGRSEKILKRYRDEYRDGRRTDGEARFNILWSNVQTLVPACFSRLPQPDVSRRFRDQDPVGRVASLILERALDYEIQHYQDYRTTMEQVVHDRFLPGRGTAWIRYEPHIKAVQLGQPEDGVEVSEDVDEPEEQLDYECSPIDYVHWKDFGHTVARTWEEVTAVWRKVYMTKRMKEERFPEIASKIPVDDPPKEKSRSDNAQDNDGSWIYEIWDKDTKTAIWIHKGMLTPLDVVDDPLGLEEFFPCPRPLYATLTNETLVPTPDFALYQDQANELDILSDRIDGFVKALKVIGVYDAAEGSLARLFTEGSNNTLIPVKNWAAFAEKQGLKGSVDVLELKNIYEALHASYEAMEQVKQQIYEITGISDIIRGQTEASETATAQQLKGQYASLRLKSMQQKVAQFATECLQLKAQVMTAKFSPQTLLSISAVDQLSEEDQQFIVPAMELLQQNPLRSFRIEVAADSLVQMDEQAEKEARAELLTAAGGYLQQAAHALQGVPPQLAGPLVKLLMDMLKFGVTGFKVGKTIEGQFDVAAEQISKALQSMPPATDPNAGKVQADAALKQQEMQHEVALENQRNQIEAQRVMAEQQQQAALENQKMTHERQLKEMELAHNQAFEKWKAELDAATKIMVAQISAKASLDQAAQAAEQAASTELTKTAQQQDQTTALVDMHGKTLDALKGVMDTLSRPKKIVRGPDGRAAGVETA